MDRSTVVTMAAAMLSLALATSVIAQQTPDFLAKRSATLSCEAMNWNVRMLKNHPLLADACLEIVVVNGQSWARFDARLSMLERDGLVVLNLVNHRDRPIEEVTFMPTSGQVAYTNDRATPFRQLRVTDRVSLYVPEGEYGFATQPRVTGEQIAEVVEPAAPVVSERAVTQTTTPSANRAANRSAVFPEIPSLLPWFALAGLLSLLGGMVLTLRR